eukprot:2539224-Prymnesium_polylepis.1
MPAARRADGTAQKPLRRAGLGLRRQPRPVSRGVGRAAGRSRVVTGAVYEPARFSCVPPVCATPSVCRVQHPSLGLPPLPLGPLPQHQPSAPTVQRPLS